MRSPDGASNITAVVFDLGGVLIDWDPRHLYRKLLRRGRGRPVPRRDRLRDVEPRPGLRWASWADAVEALAARHPHRRDLIAAFPARFPETLGGPIEGTVELLRELHAGGTRLLALTNWSGETFPHADATFDFLGRFEGIVVSGVEGVAKPDPALFRSCSTATALDPAATVFVDDSPDQRRGCARAVGLQALLFTDPETLRTRPQPARSARRCRIRLTPSRTVSITTSTRSSATTWSLNSRIARVVLVVVLGVEQPPAPQHVVDDDHPVRRELGQRPPRSRPCSPACRRR